jgi:hypothetical protein
MERLSPNLTNALPGINLSEIRELFLVSTPLQVINAYEALEYFDCKPEESLVVLLDNHTPMNSRHLKQIIAHQKWKNVHHLPYERRRSLARLRLARRSVVKNVFLQIFEYSLRRTMGIPVEQLIIGRHCFRELKHLCKRLPSLRHCFVGYFGSPFMRHASNSVESDDIVILEEGVNQLHLYDDIHAQKKKFSRIFYLNPAANFFRRIFFGMRLSPCMPLHFYTAYDLPSSNRITVSRNSYMRFRGALQSSSRTDDVFFLGEWLTAWNCFTDDQYVDYLTKAREDYSGRRFVFLPHRRTPKATQEAISNIPGIEIRDLGGPVEVAIANMDPRPGVITGFFSSALFNVSMMFGDEIEVTTYRIPTGHMRENLREFIDDFYEYSKRYFSGQVKVVNRLLEDTE